MVYCNKLLCITNIFSFVTSRLHYIYLQNQHYFFNFLLQIQFVAIFTHQFQILFTDCNYPKGFMIWIALHGIMFLFLFSDFYKTKYTNTKKPAQKKDNGACMVSTCLVSLMYLLICYFLQPLLDEGANGIRKSNSNGTLNNSYIKSEFSDSYEACYSNGSTKGFVTQTITKHNNKKIE